MINKDEYKPEVKEELTGLRWAFKLGLDILKAILIFVLGIAAIIVFLWGGCWILSYMGSQRTW